MRSTMWFVSLMAVVALWAVGCGVPQEQYDADTKALKDALTAAQDEAGKASSELAQLKSSKDALEAQLAALQNDLGQLSADRDKNAKALDAAKKREAEFKKMMERFASMVKSGKLKIKIVNNKMLVEMASEILFDSGKPELSDEGKIALTEVAGILKTIPDRSFQVAGHTDNVPIKNKRFKSNWSLSSARAVAVVEHFIENGVDSKNLAAAGYGETQPAASNDAPEGKAKNRRIEIVLQPNLDELPDLSSLEKMVQ